MKRNAQFIWTPDQEIDHAAYFRLVSREPLRRDSGVNRWVLFRKSFKLNSGADSADLKITCDGRYKLFVNGKYVTRGPARSGQFYLRVDELDIASLLGPGTNVIAVLVHVPGVDLAWYEATKGAWQPVFGDGGLYADLCIETGSQSTSVKSDESWKYLEAQAWGRAAPRSGWGQDFIEVFDAEKMPEDWAEPLFDDAAWGCAQIMQSNGSEADRATGRGSHVPHPILTPREIPQLRETKVAAARMEWARGVRPRPDLPVDQQLYEEELCDAPNGMFTRPENLAAGNGVAKVVTSESLDAAIMLVFDPCITGCPFIEIEAHGGETIEIAAAEAVPGEFPGKGARGRGLDRPDFLTGAHIFRYKAKPGRQTFEKFEWTAVRALQITVRNARKGVDIHSIGVTTVNYPVEYSGQFQCNDDLLGDLWRVGRHTAEQCMHDAFEDCPSREKRQWVGDGVVHLDIAEAAFGPSAYPLGKQFLKHVAESQRPDGLTQMFAPGDHRSDGVIIPDFTLHWIRGVYSYWMSTGDIALIEHLFPAIERALIWFGRLRTDSGLITDIPYWHFIEWAHLDRSGASTAINALYVAALNSAACLSTALGYSRAAQRYAKLARETSDSLNAYHWNEARGAYVDSIDAKTGKQKQRVSQQANSLMIAFEIAPRERWNTIIASISDEALLKYTSAPPIFVNAPPFDEARDIVRSNTFFCHFLYDAFARAGRFDLALDHMRKTYKPMLDAGATTLWESFESSASLCHVFSATPVFQLSRHSLGVQPARPGFQAVRIAPQFADLDFAKGIYPNLRGDIAVAWKRREDCYILEATVPAGVEVEIVSPAGFDSKSETHEDGDGQCRVTVQFRREARNRS